MKLDLRTLLDQLAKAPLRTKVIAAASVVALVAIVAIGGVVASQPHFVKLYTNLGDSERVAVEKALAGAKVSYRISDFPGPFVVWVDESRFDEAQIAVALASGLAQAPRGIDAASSGASTIFMSAGERAQSMQKREWQECERLLEKLDFVASATVTTSMPESSPLRAKKPVMVSVALSIRGATTLAGEQAHNVAKLVCNRFGVPAENVVISDQTGRMLYDAAASGDHGAAARDMFERGATHDRELAAKANAQIEATFGRRKALVTVTSRWNYDQSTTVDEKIDPETVVLSTDVRSTSTPANSATSIGGPTGVASNIASDFGNGNAQVPNPAQAPAQTAKPDAPATTRDEKKVFDASRSKVQTIHSTPTLERLFVSLVIDASLAAKKDEIRSLVEAAVGFDALRQDVLGVSTTTFAADALVDGGPSSTPPTTQAKPESGPSTTTTLLLERGVEIAAALAFIALLATSLRPGRKRRVELTETGEPVLEVVPQIDPELLARAQVEELVRSDPRRVGEILSRWAEEVPSRAAR